MSRLLFIAVVLALALPLPAVFAPVLAADVPATEDGKRKINLSGRQRMLSQRMAKAACFASLGVQTGQHLRQTREAHELFDTTLRALLRGDAEMGMNATTAPRILEAMASVEALWLSYGSAVLSASQNEEAAQAALPQISELNVPVLRQMNTAVSEFERYYGGKGEIHPVLALAINVAGRQRMLSQKAAKEFCLILSGRSVDANRKALSDTVALFETSLAALMVGDDDMGLPPAPTDDIQNQLETVKALWEPLKAIFDATAAGTVPSPGDVATVARDNNPLLKEMNQAVWMYDQL